MLTKLGSYLPDLPDLLALMALLVVAAAFLGIGRLLDARERQPPEVWLLSGWAVGHIAAVVFGVTTAAPLLWVLYPALAVGALGWASSWRAASPARRESARLTLVGLPLLLIVSAASASQWDEFAHWLVNQRYLVEVGTFPRRGLPENPTNFSAYPYGLAVVGLTASGLAGGFVENAGALLNTALILALAAAAVRSFRAGAAMVQSSLTWTQCALGFLAATLLNPAFVPKLVFTTYADWTTAVVLGVAVATGWRLVNALLEERDADARSAALHTGLAAALLAGLKQPNIILVVLLWAGVFASLLAASRAAVRRAGRSAIYLIAPAIIVYLAWRYHVVQHIPGREFSFFPLADWLWGDLGNILGRMGLIASKKGGYFGLMLAATATAAYSVVSMLRGRTSSPLGRLAILVAVIFLGYNFFLYVAYVGAFGEWEGRNAASYWRYNTQLGGAALIFAAAGIGEIYRRRGARISLPPWSRAVIVCIAVLLPIAMAAKIRFDLNPVTRYVRSVGVDLSGELPPGSRLVVFDPLDNGKRTLVMRYETLRTARTERLAVPDPNNPDVLREVLGGLQGAYIWVHVPSPALAAALRITLPPGSSYLLRHQDGRWGLMKSWPYPGYSDPGAEDD